MDQEGKRYPLSSTQEWFIGLDQGDEGGPFGARYLIVSAFRIAGPVDLAVLQGALDDVVARHELLRTLVIRDDDPPYQMVFPIAEGAKEVDEVLLEEAESSDILSGTEWHLSPQPDGAVNGSLHFNLDEFEENTVKGWTATLERIVASAVRDPGQDWRQL